MTLPGATANLTESVDIIAIAINDRSIHWYPNVKGMLDCGNTHLVEAHEFFNRDGYRLTPVFNAQWQIIDLRQATEPPQVESIRYRIHRVLGSIENRLRLPVDGDSESVKAKKAEAIQYLVQLHDLGLAAIFDALGVAPLAYEDSPTPSDDGGVVHNWIFHTFF